MNTLTKQILCADDFGLSPGICEGILKLAQEHRLSAVSCMVNMPYFEYYLPDLLKLKDKIAIGLHFNLTEGFLLSQPNKPCFTLPELLFKTHIHVLSNSLIKEELLIQLERFVDNVGSVPNFIDGHQHVHQFPQVRAILIELCKQRLNSSLASTRECGGQWCEQLPQMYIRSTYPILSVAPYHKKGTILAFTGGKALKSALKKNAINHNDWFAGVYDFSPGVNYRSLFKQWLQLAPENTLIMCHPGEGVEKTDPIAHARLVEMAYFSSEQFIEDCRLI